MTRHFVLDENIIIGAQTQRNEREQSDSTSLQLIIAIERNCHALIFAGDMWAKYSRPIQHLQDSGVLLTPRVIALIKSILTNIEKDNQWVQDENLQEVDGLDDMPGVDAGDQVFVRAAASVEGSILVTTDARLLAAIRTSGIVAAHKFHAMDPSEALAVASVP